MAIALPLTILPTNGKFGTLELVGSGCFSETVAHDTSWALKWQPIARLRGVPCVSAYQRAASMPEPSFRFLDPNSPRRAPDYGSRKMQFKLMMLVGSLFAVLWCMQYAGRPETWQWLVELDETPASRRAEPNVLDADTPGEPAPEPRNSPLPSDPIWPNPLAADGTTSRLPVAVEALFWRIALERLSPEQLFVLVDAVYQWSTDLASTLEAEPVLQSTLLKLANLRQQLDRQLNSIVAMNGGGTNQPEKSLDSTATETADTAETSANFLELPALEPTAMTRPLFPLPASIPPQEAQSMTDHSRWLMNYWNPLIQSAEYAEREQTVSGNSESELLLSQAVANRDHWQFIRTHFLEPHLHASIVDGSRLGRPEERAAWLHFVHLTKVKTFDNGMNPRAKLTRSETVTRQNLLGQPELFRGKRVRIDGMIRRIERIRQSDPLVAKTMKSPEYVVVWLQPSVSGQGPYCVYCTDDPALAELALDQSDPRRMASVEGWFFKLYPYTSANGKTAICPLLITDKIAMREQTPTAAPAMLSSGQWSMVIACISLLAVGLATAGWYSTRYRSANPLGARKRSQTHVNWLASQSVPNPGETLRKLAANDDQVAPE
jgi:hypothetical protein